MRFKFHLFVQRHNNRTYTAVPLPFYELAAYGTNLEEVKSDLVEALKERVGRMPPNQLHTLEFDSGLSLTKARVEVRPVDRKTRKKRREIVRLMFSLLVSKDEDGQYLVTVPKLGQPPLAFFAYRKDEIQSTASNEITSWLDGMTLDKLLEYQYARTEKLDTLEVDVNIRKPGKSQQRSQNDARNGSEGRSGSLREVGINLTALAAEGRFRKTYRRDDVVDTVLRTLSGERNSSVLLTGNAEVGKTSVMHEVVRRIQAKECDPALHDREVWMLTPDRLIAGAQYIGTWEERLKGIVSECRKERHILFVEDLPGLIETGRWSKSDQNVAQALKPHIEAGEVTVFGEAGEERLRMGEGTAPGFINLFRQVRVEPMSEPETLSLLRHVSRDLERELSVRLDSSAGEAAVGLTRRFLPYRALPGKAIRLLESATADALKAHDGLFRPLVTRDRVITTFAAQSGMPEFIVADSARLDPAEVQTYFETRILGQVQAVSSMVDLVTRVKAGLNDPEKPLGTFMFIGPTGVGKTQMAKALASYLFGDEDRMIRFDMSEYIGADGVARLTGAFNSDGELTRRVREQPFCVLLLDEFEKADPRIYDIMLQVFGEGRLTDANGRTTYFHNAIIIMTSNLGSEQRAFRPPGFVRDGGGNGESGDLAAHYRSSVEAHYRPEFVNRIDQIVIFDKLSDPAMRQIAARELGEVLLRDGITRRGMLVEIDDSVIDLVLRDGYSPIYGARPLKREIENLIVSPLARELALRHPDEQALFRVYVDEGEITLKTVPIDDAGQSTTVALSSAMDGQEGRRMRLDGPGLVEGFAEIRRQLADWHDSDIVQEMTRRKESLLKQTTEPDFWDYPDRARQRMTRLYFLDRLLRRLQQLTEKAEYLEDFAILVNRERDSRYQTELAADYAELYRNASYLNIELLTAHLPHRNQAMMLITPVGAVQGDPERPQEAWPRRLSELYLRWAERKGCDRDLYLLVPQADAPGGLAFQQVQAGGFRQLLKRYARQEATEEIALLFQGANVFGFLKGERGIHKLLGKDPGVEEHARVQVFAIPDGTDIAVWLADYQRIKTEIVEGQRQQPPAEKLSVVRNYALERSERYIRDTRTNVRLTNVRDVISKGLIDPFILAFLETEERATAWEDRFPRTFPF